MLLKLLDRVINRNKREVMLLSCAVVNEVVIPLSIAIK